MMPITVVRQFLKYVHVISSTLNQITAMRTLLSEFLRSKTSKYLFSPAYFESNFEYVIIEAVIYKRSRSNR